MGKDGKEGKIKEFAKVRTISDAHRWWTYFAQIDNSWDSLFSTVLVFAIAVASCASFLISISDVVRYYDKALPLQVLTNDIAGLALHLGSLLLWAAMCFGTRKKERDFVLDKKFKHFWVHRALSYKVWGHDFLAVGFAPRLFACTMGILLFVSGNCVTTNVIPGGKFLHGRGVLGYYGWPVGMGCRADSTKPAIFRKIWGSRFRIASAKGCYMVNSVGNDVLKRYAGGTDMGWSKSNFFWDRPPNTGKAKTFPIENLVFPWQWKNGTRVLNKKRTCFYQCAKWKPIAFQALLKNSGSILAGAIFITKLIDTLTTARWLPHYKFVSTDTKPVDVKKAVERTLKGKPLWLSQRIHMKRLFALIMITGIKMFLQSLCPRIDKDGYLTLDYYVTLVFTYAAAFAIVLRNFHICEFTPMVFTSDLWEKGKDTFIGVEEGEALTIDLYEWYHLPASDRAQFLLNFARSITMKKVSYWQPGLDQDDLRKDYGFMVALMIPLVSQTHCRNDFSKWKTV
jgi:hypothetical protein